MEHAPRINMFSAPTKQNMPKATLQKIFSPATAGNSGIASKSYTSIFITLHSKPARFLLREILHLTRCICRLVIALQPFLKFTFKLQNRKLDFLASCS